jgi:hypothetical protein
MEAMIEERMEERGMISRTTQESGIRYKHDDEERSSICGRCSIISVWSKPLS